MQTTPAATDIAPARPSSTVVLLRQGEQRPEIFMVKRHERSSFGSAYAFPGGVLESSDRKVHSSCVGRSSAQANELLSVDNAGLDYFSAAVRELFEEAGVLLGSATMSASDLSDVRNQLNDESLSWEQFVADSKLRIQCDHLHYFSFWITPTAITKRYSTRFFLAQLPDGQIATHDDGELTDSCWMSAQDALEAGRAGQIRVHYPTRKNLENMASYQTVDELIDWADSCGKAGVPCIQPEEVPESER